MRPIAWIGLTTALGFVAADASAVPPGHWSVGVERLFGVSHTWQDSQGPNSTSQTSLSIFAPHADRIGYSATRVGVDYLLDQGFSFGAALGYGEQHAERDDDLRLKTMLFAPRFGFLAMPTPTFGVWMRAGLTLTKSAGANVSAVTLEVPVLLLVPGHVVGVTLMPYYEHGIENVDVLHTHRTLSELGACVGFHAFF